METFKLKTLSEKGESEIGQELADNLFLKRDPNNRDRYKTQWGSKTPLGLYRTILRIVNDASKKQVIK